MRIGIDARELPGRPTGVGRVLAGLLDAWPEDDELVLYARRPVPWRHLGGRRRARQIPGPAGMPGSIWEQVLLPRALRLDRVEALFSPAYGMPRLAPCPVVVGMHDCAAEAMPEEFGTRERLRRRWAGRTAARHAAFLLTGSRFAAREIEHWYGTPARRVVVARYGADAAFGEVAEDDRTDAARRWNLSGRSLLFVGAPLARRDLGMLVEVAAELAATRDDLTLSIVGPRGTPPRALAESGAARLLGRRLRWLGFVPDADLPALYAAATAVVYPSRYEGFGLPVLEALACGTPVVAADAGSLAEIFDGRAWLVPAGARDAWAWALSRILDDPAERRRQVETATPWARRRRWDAAARLLRRLLAHAAGQATGGDTPDEAAGTPGQTAGTPGEAAGAGVPGPAEGT